MLRNQNGSVLIVALIMLVVLTLLGISITKTSELETQIAGNERIYRQDLYAAEAAALIGAQTLANTSNLEDNPPSWVFPFPSGVTDSNITNDTDPIWTNAQSVTGVPNSSFLVVGEGVANFASLDMTRSTVYQYTIYGRYLDSRGRSIVKVGYRMAY